MTRTQSLGMVACLFGGLIAMYHGESPDHWFSAVIVIFCTGSKE